MQEALNQFGGFWTQHKIEIFIKYLFAYLEIMKNQRFKLIYFDGFAGCGRIEPENSGIEENKFIESVALQVLGMEHPKLFDIYYVVDKHKKRSSALNALVKKKFPDLNAHVVRDDCNIRLIGMTDYMRQNDQYRALAFIDPFGMNLKWSSIEICRNLGIDMWILIPTGVAVNRLLMRKQERIPESWLGKLEEFYGLPIVELRSYFYREEERLTLFGSETHVQKIENAIHKAVELYKQRLGTVWKYVSTPFPMKNSAGSTMYHFVIATNYASGFGIANDIIGKKLSQG
ncbi:MAG: three-Cys-motif partner protein TcmP [Rudanella sp.]|nr:three-Cys-motif partner protein TcmP [Rudanella sp.]